MKIYQISTLQALALGYIRSVVTVKELLEHGDIGLGTFHRVCARSESAYRSHHVDLKDILSKTQRDFAFENIAGTMVCLYYPDYMDGINAPGWHVHFLSEDRTKGGHVFDLEIARGMVRIDKITNIEIQLPSEPAFDTYSLKEASGSDIKKVEQGNGKE